MRYGMTIRTDRTQIADRVHFVFSASASDFRQMMVDMDEALGHCSIDTAKRKPTDETGIAILSDALAARDGISFVLVDQRAFHRTFGQSRVFPILA